MNYNNRLKLLVDEMMNTIVSVIQMHGRCSATTMWPTMPVLDDEIVEVCVDDSGRLILIDDDGLHYDIGVLGATALAILTDWIQENYK